MTSPPLPNLDGNISISKNSLDVSFVSVKQFLPSIRWNAQIQERSRAFQDCFPYIFKTGLRMKTTRMLCQQAIIIFNIPLIKMKTLSEYCMMDSRKSPSMATCVEKERGLKLNPTI
jgi:hypothetical protein